jgi:hypothetical protein
MSPSRRSLSRAALTVALAAVAAAMALAGPELAFGAASSGPTYRVAVAPTALAAGTSAATTLTLTQLVGDDAYHGKELGSVRITPPAGFTLTGATAARGSYALPVTIAAGAVTVEKLDLEHAGQSATVTLQAKIPCGVAGTASWVVVGHSTDTFSNSHATTLVQDPASTSTAQVAGCSLAFAAQPAAAAAGKVISSQAANPAGAPVSVQVRDGNGNPAAQAGLTISLSIAAGTGTAGAVLAGTRSSAAGATGLATFAPTIDRAGHAYQLLAQAGIGITPATSAAFEVSDVATVCSGACSVSTQSGTTSATVSGNSNGGVLTASLGLDNVDCNNAVNHNYVATSQAVTFDLSQATGRTLVTMKIAAASVTKLWFKYEVCFSSPNSTFVNKYGATIPAGQAGILPSCFFDCDRPSTGPCVLLKWFDFRGNVYVLFSVPAGDPRGQI